MNPLSQPAAKFATSPPSKFGDAGLFNNILNAVQLGAGLYGQLHGGQAGGQGGAQCARTTVTCLDTLIGQYQQAMAAAGTNRAALIDIVTQALAAVNNPQIFTQNNDPYLVNTRNQLTARLQSLQQGEPIAPAQVVTATGGAVPLPGGTVAAGGTQLIDGVSNTTLMIGAAGIAVAIYALKSQ